MDITNRFLPSILNACCYFAYLMHAYLKSILNNLSFKNKFSLFIVTQGVI